jgi:K+-sensing histidine kinase KdpD
MNDAAKDTNALLLQVMAHDLLAPLTAIKWQLELLNHAKADSESREKHIKGIAGSAELGISLTKHAHVAGQVLTGAYKPMPEEGSLPKLISHVADELVPQFERHALTLTTEIGEEKRNRMLDKPLSELLIWALTKFFLTVAPANTKISMRGIAVESDESNNYLLVVDGADIPDQDVAAALFTETQVRDAYDQGFVFAMLVQETAKLLGATVTASSQPNLLAVELIFPGDEAA